MKFAVTGDTRTPRADLYDKAIGVGLVPMNSVSTRCCRPPYRTACRIRVLVLGGPHEAAVDARDRAAAAGARIAVNLTPTVSRLVALPGAKRDPRWMNSARLIRLDPTDLTVTADGPTERLQMPVDMVSKDQILSAGPIPPPRRHG